MQALQRVRVVRWRKLSRRHRFVVGPYVDHEAVTHVDAWLHSRIKYGYRTVGLREPFNKFNLGLCARLIVRPLRVHADGLVRDRRDAGDDVAWQ
jgi:hypothetical protein